MPYENKEGGPFLSRATVTKEFSGGIEGESTAELLMCRADEKSTKGGAGYVASEAFSGSVDGRSGAFVMQHAGVEDLDGSHKTYGFIVPGSGQQELAGLRGEVEISVSKDGTHSLVLNCEMPAHEE